MTHLSDERLLARYLALLSRLRCCLRYGMRSMDYGLSLGSRVPGGTDREVAMIRDQLQEVLDEASARGLVEESQLGLPGCRS